MLMFFTLTLHFSKKIKLNLENDERSVQTGWGYDERGEEDDQMKESFGDCLEKVKWLTEAFYLGKIWKIYEI